ncbi:C-5 cytosine methyltransferase [Colletotrichum asianum]
MPPSKRQRVKEESDPSDSDGSEYGVESDNDGHHDSVAPGIHMLGLSQDYVPSWTEGDAFREWYQNWKDSIIQTFDLNPRPFILDQKTTGAEIQITIHRTIKADANYSETELLGYIKFIKQTGTLELANFSAALNASHLSLGGTTKRESSKTAGTHGEGFKVAALVMTRQNRTVQIESSGAYWKFGFRGVNKDKFACQITKPATSITRKHHDSLLFETRKGQARKRLTSYIHRDVTVRISTLKDHEIITEKQFWDWTSVSIDLHCPSPEKIIRTERGDLLLGPPFAGRIYLKGLRVSEHGSDGANYSYGYDFASGRINRDRERMMNQKEEARIVANIWESAAIERPELTKEYVKLFDIVRSPDVACADSVVSKKMAGHVWQHLLKDAPDCFFYGNDPHSQSNVAHQAHLINKDLKKKARMLPRELWKTLRRFKLVRTPEEHIDHEFLGSQAIALPKDVFAISVDRMLQAAMQLEWRLKRFRVTYVKSEHTSIDVRQSAHDLRLLIHEKWLSFDTAHLDASCDISEISKATRKQAGVFACDHIVEDLFDIVLRTVMGATDSDALKITQLRLTARNLFRQIPRDIQVSAGSLPSQLRVSWACNDPGIISKYHGDDIDFQVRLHRDISCRTKEHILLLDWATSMMPGNSCPCPTQKVPLSTCFATFDGLDPQQKYFPMKDDGGANARSIESTPGYKEWVEDEQAWRDWHAKDLPTKISYMFATRNACKCDVTDTLAETSFESRRLNFNFEKDQYIKINDNSGSFATYIALVHDVSPGSVHCLKTPHLVITKYSSFDHAKLLWDSETTLDDYKKSGRKELLLHCTEPKKMGTFSDNEVVAIDDINWVGPVGADFCIMHCAESPDDLDAEEFFCRFARSVHDDSLAILPISPHLLAPRHRRKLRGFPDASTGWVTDLTPEVLGPMEGFCSAGYRPFAAFGFDEKRDATWKIRHPACPVFDGYFPQLLEDIDKGKVPGLSWPSSNSPMTVLASIKNANFALTKGNKVMPERKTFFEPLAMAVHAFESGHPDFTVIQSPPAVLHPLAVARLCKSIVHFLENYNAVRIDASSVQDFHVPQSRRLLTMIASPYQGIAAVPMTQAHQQLGLAGQAGKIAELSFGNPRAAGTGFVCSLPSGVSQDKSAPSIPCYNHATGFTLTEGKAQVVDLELQNIDFVTYSNRGLVHPVREDSLTVREFARVQGFPDDFVFYGSREDQYDQVTLAQPPPVARAAAECIRTVILRSKAVKLGDENRTARQNKRRRQDDDE